MYEIYAIKIGERVSSTSVLFFLPDPPAEAVLPFYFWVLKGRGEAILVDTGFTAGMIRGRPLRSHDGPLAQAAKLGVKPADVTAVIATHVHWDHFGGWSLWPRATFYLQRREFDFYTGPLTKYWAVNRFLDPGLGAALRSLQQAGRLRLLDDEEEIRPGLRPFWVGGHTPGLQAVAVETRSGPFVLLSDLPDTYRNFEEDLPGGIITNVAEWLRGFERVKRIAPTADRVAPQHDPALFERYPAVGEGIVRVA